ncbi:hypothetical protein [Gordonibacter urolithinfaciens]|uniref:hypothetical protein n=1 Tax=Gordonibacter urolithinfaciens TaxID=1335613 RepID=UPI001D072BA7|nr:hypothetical protein [Gordonibacter urolithinfaciens]MCB7085803.1 hypothetical protein [Gordonibacter urolithinfaciens]
MRIVDAEGAEVESPDLSLGHLVADRLLIAHHPAVEAVEEQGHWETVAEYPETGGRDVVWAVDVEAVEVAEAWDEWEDVWRYVPYTPDELAEIERERAEAEAAAEEARKKAEEARKKEEERDAITDATPARFESVEAVQLDHDEAVASLYEAVAASRIETDEAIVALYESMIGGNL